MADCVWCGRDFTPRSTAARFCSAKHRAAFHSAARALGERMFAEGAITIEQLRAEASCTAQGEEK